MTNYQFYVNKFKRIKNWIGFCTGNKYQTEWIEKGTFEYYDYYGDNLIQNEDCSNIFELIFFFMQDYSLYYFKKYEGLFAGQLNMLKVNGDRYPKHMDRNERNFLKSKPDLPKSNEFKTFENE